MKFIFLLITLLLTSSFFQYPVIDSYHFDWRLYEYDPKNNGKKCYILSHPIKSNSDHGQKRDPYIMVTRFKDSNIEEVSIFSDFEYKINSKIRILIDDYPYYFFTKNDMAWPKTAIEDKNIIQKMIGSKIIKVRSDSSLGTFAIDQYSMKGFVRAYNRMKNICS